MISRQQEGSSAGGTELGQGPVVVSRALMAPPGLDLSVAEGI